MSEFKCRQYIPIKISNSNKEKIIPIYLHIEDKYLDYFNINFNYIYLLNKIKNIILQNLEEFENNIQRDIINSYIRINILKDNNNNLNIDKNNSIENENKYEFYFIYSLKLTKNMKFLLDSTINHYSLKHYTSFFIYIWLYPKFSRDNIQNLNLESSSSSLSTSEYSSSDNLYLDFNLSNNILPFDEL